ncbi:unnamed protein product [Periconia digitata]|uniref:Uncharacterized protein n=1 Tax=Periconia digitata TaxID=1303443 RepID=A0A9W4UGF1_9PLEO|nr:unnamed protein product [Periconia digitata]
MSRSTSYSSSSASHGGLSFPMLNEHFHTLPPTLGATTEARLQQHRRRLSLRDSSLVISTALSGTAWLATATMTDIVLYDLNSQDRTQDFKPQREIPIKMDSKYEKIRAIAISDHLLAVVTHCRLLVYEYAQDGEENLVDDVRIDVNQSWTPKSVAILQAKYSSNIPQTDVACIAVGGEGVNGVKLFKFSKATCWTAHRNHRIILKCHSATSSIRDVGFSQFIHANRFVVFGVTSDNRIMCWDVCSDGSSAPTVLRGWVVDSDAGRSSLSHRAEITSVSIFDSPSGRPYLFCAVNQKHGSQQLRSCVVPLNRESINLCSDAVSLPSQVAGRHVLAGAVSSNGRFLVTVQENSMKLSTLRGAYQGGVTCLESHLDWHSPLKGTAKDMTGISLFLKEGQSRLEITAVDGRGHLSFATISTPCVPISQSLSLGPRLRRMTPELAAEPIIRELDGEGMADEIVVRLG